VQLPIVFEHDRNCLVDGLSPLILQAFIPVATVKLPDRHQEGITERCEHFRRDFQALTVPTAQELEVKKNEKESL